MAMRGVRKCVCDDCVEVRGAKEADVQQAS
jgi:hypothetical protein